MIKPPLPREYNSPEAGYLSEHCSEMIDQAALLWAGIPDDVLEPAMVKLCTGIVEQLRLVLPDISDDQCFAWVDGLNRAICARLDQIEAAGMGSRA